MTLEQLAQKTKAASTAIMNADTQRKNQLLATIAKGLEEHMAAILEANQKDVETGKANGMSAGLLDRMMLNEERMKLEVQEKNTDNDAAGNDQADIEERESPQSTSEYADIGIASVLNYVNLRAEPSVESEALGKLYNNSAATVLETVRQERNGIWSVQVRWKTLM